MSEAHRLDESEILSTRETLRAVTRAIRYMAPFRGRFAVKLGLLGLSLIPMLLLPWPVKIIIDHVVEGVPVAEPIRPHPAFLQPLMELLDTERVATAEALRAVM